MPQPKGVSAAKTKKVQRRRRRRRKWRLKEQQRHAGLRHRAVERALEDLGVDQILARSLRPKLRSMHRLMGKVFGLMFPVFFGCQSYQELCRVQGWDKNLPGRALGALPKRKWVAKLRRISQDLLESLRRRVESMSEATRSRWQWTFLVDSTVFRKFGSGFSLVKPSYSNQDKRIAPGIDGVLLAVVVGDGKLIVPLDFEIRRPHPPGAGHPCRTKLEWTEAMLQRNLGEFERRGLQLNSPVVVADSWFADSHLMQWLKDSWGGTLLVETKSSFIFEREDGTVVSAKELTGTLAETLGFRSSTLLPSEVRYVRMHAQSPTFGNVTLTVVSEPGEELYCLMCLTTSISSPRLWRVYSRRNWVEWCFRSLKSLLAAGKCQFVSEDAYYGHLIMRLLGLLVISYTSRRVLRGRVTMEQIIFSHKHHWRTLDSNLIETQILS